MRRRSLHGSFRFRPYLVCPDCRSKYTTDHATKKRAALIAVGSLVTLGLSTAGLLAGFPWGLAAAIAGIGLIMFVGHTLSRITYVEYRSKR